jgi:hypothetical protein
MIWIHSFLIFQFTIFTSPYPVGEVYFLRKYSLLFYEYFSSINKYLFSFLSIFVNFQYSLNVVISHLIIWMLTTYYKFSKALIAINVSIFYENTHLYWNMFLVLFWHKESKNLGQNWKINTPRVSFSVFYCFFTGK